MSSDHRERLAVIPAIPFVQNRMENRQFGKFACRQTVRAVRSIRHLDRTVRRIMDNPGAWGTGEPEQITARALTNDVAEVMVHMLSMRMNHPRCMACIEAYSGVMISLRQVCERMDQLASMIRTLQHRAVVKAAVDEIRSNSWIQA